MILEGIRRRWRKLFEEWRSGMWWVEVIGMIEEGRGKVEVVCVERVMKVVKVRF